MSPSRLCVLCVCLVGTSPALAQKIDDLRWLAAPTLSTDSVRQALDAIITMTPDGAAREAAALFAGQRGFSPEGRVAAGFLAGAALERANEAARAKQAYESVVGSGAGTEYAIASAERIRWLGLAPNDDSQREKYFAALAQGADRNGWFFVGNQWLRTSSRRAGLQGQVNLRASRLSFRVFDFLRSKSTLPPDYAYLFILIVAAIGVKIVALPLQVKSAIQAARFRRLRPQIEMIQRIHRGDPLEAQRQMQRLVGPDSIKYGCALAVVDLVFVVWGLMTLRDYSPQLALDGARFFSVTDVTKPSTVVFWLWIGLSLLQAVVSARAQRMGFGHALVAGLFSGCLFVAIAWYWEWPAYVMIFWGLLTLMALALNLLLLPIAIVRARQDPGYAGTF